MKCNNCGAKMQPGEKFCPVCGQQAENQVENEKEQLGAMPNHVKKPKKSSGFKIGIAIALIAVLALGTVAGAKVIGMIKKAGMSPAEYYQYVETKNRDSGEKLILGYYDKFRESFAGDSYAKEIKMKIEASNTAKSLLSLTGLDITNVKNLELNLLTGKEGKAYSNQMKLRGNGSDLLTFNTYMDWKDKKAYYQIPELSQSYLDISDILSSEKTAEVDQEGGSLDGAEADSSVEDLNIALAGTFLPLYDLDSILVETDDIKEIYERYTDLLIKSANNVKKSEGGCEAEGVSQKADQYSVTLEDKEVTALAKKFVETLKSDQTIKEIVENMGQDTYQEYTDRLERELDSIEGTQAGEIEAVMDVQVGSKDRIIGRKITLTWKDGSEQEERIIDMRCPRDGDDFGLTFSVEADGEEILSLHGRGTEKLGIVNGEFTLDTNGSLNLTDNSLLSAGKLLIVTLEDYDLSKYAEGKMSGTITYSTEAVASLANYFLKIEGGGDMKESSGKITILAGKEPFVTVHVTMNSDVELGTTKPSKSDTVYDLNDSGDMAAYQSEMDILELLEDVQEKLEIDFSDFFRILWKNML